MILIGLLSMGGVLAATAPFQLFISGNRVKVHPVTLGGRIYLPLEETARLFHQKVTVDLASRRIVLEPMTAEEEAAAPVELPESPVILGDVVMNVENNVTKPLGRIKVELFKRPTASSDDTEQRAVELWIQNGDTRFLDAHGLVSQTATNADGQFGFSKIPPGNYLILAVMPISPVEIAYWRIPLKLAARQTQNIHLNLKDAARVQILK